MFVHIYMSNMKKIISLPFNKDRQIDLVGLLLLMILLHVPTQSCSGCYLSIFWHIRLIISAMKVSYYQTVGEVASLPSCDLLFQGQIDLGAFSFWGCNIFIFWHECGLISGSVNNIFMSIMGHWPLTSMSNNGYRFRYQLPHLTRFNI